MSQRVGIGPCFPLCSIHSTFNSTSGRGQFSHSCLIEDPSSQQPWLVFVLFLLSWCSKCSHTLQAGKFSNQTLLLWSHAVRVDEVCGIRLSFWNIQGTSDKDIICKKVYISVSIDFTFPDFRAASSRHWRTSVPSERQTELNTIMSRLVRVLVACSVLVFS